MSETVVKLGYVPKNRGEYNSSKQYYNDNIVQYNGSSYIAHPTAQHNQGNAGTSEDPVYYLNVAPTDNSTPPQLRDGWEVFASGNNTFVSGQSVDQLSVENTPTAGHTTALITSAGVSNAVASSNAKVGYYECPTEGNEQAKVVSAAAPDYVLSTGGSFKIKMTNKNIAASGVTLNINGTGAKVLYYDGELVTNDNTWDANEVVDVYYDGTSYYANNVSGGGKFLTGEKVKEVGIDSTPTADSNNLVTSGGVTEKLKNVIDSVGLEAEKILFATRLLKIDGTYSTSIQSPLVKTMLYCDEVLLTYNKEGYTHGAGYCACWITDETGDTMIQGFNMDVIGFSGTIKIQKPEGADVWYLVWPQDGTLILNPYQLSKRISFLEDKEKEDSEIYYIDKVQQVGEEFDKYVGQNGRLYSVAGFGSNKFSAVPGIYNFKTAMPANSSVSLWAAYKGDNLVIKGNLTTVSRDETFDLSFYDIDTIYISWTEATKDGAVLTKINTSISDNNSALLNILNQSLLGYAKINDDTISLTSAYSSRKIEDNFVGLIIGKNIFNKDLVVLGEYIDVSDGKTLHSNEESWYSPEYMPISPSQDYICNKNGNYFCFYDEDKNFISTVSVNSFTTPNNAKYLRITGFSQSQIDSLQVEIGSSSTTYEPYQKVIPPALIQTSVANSLFVDLKIVDKQGTYGFTSINSAVGAVQDGGVVLVMPGEYEEAVFCQSKEVNIIGLSRDDCILFNTLGDYYNAPLYQSAGSLKNMTVWSKWDSNKDYSEIEHLSYAIHIDNYGENKKYSIENCHLISDFSNTLGCGARPNHVLTVKDCLVEHTNAYKEAFPSASTGGSNCMNMHGGGNESITLINNIFISKTTDLVFGFGEGNTDVFKLLCVNNAIETVSGLISSHFDINSRSYGNLNASLNYTT